MFLGRKNKFVYGALVLGDRTVLNDQVDLNGGALGLSLGALTVAVTLVTGDECGTQQTNSHDDSQNLQKFHDKFLPIFFDKTIILHRGEIVNGQNKFFTLCTNKVG